MLIEGANLRTRLSLSLTAPVAVESDGGERSSDALEVGAAVVGWLWSVLIEVDNFVAKSSSLVFTDKMRSKEDESGKSVRGGEVDGGEYAA